MLENPNFLKKLLVAVLEVTMFCLSHQCQRCHNLNNLESILKVYELYHMPDIDTDQERPDPNRHALDSDPDPTK
jgi:hypothetical protein